MLLLGCIADDLTGATDLGITLAREGLSVIQVNGIPDSDLAVPVADAVVVALKSRTIAPADAVAQALAALAWLRARGAERIYFKYCSTFDSTPRGNIGPVTEALRTALGVAPGGVADARDARLSAQRAHGLSRPPVRRRRPALRLGHAQPSADADDRRQPRPRARGADDGQGRTRAVCRRGRRGGRRARAARGACRRRLRARDRGRDARRAPGRGGTRLLPTCRSPPAARDLPWVSRARCAIAPTRAAARGPCRHRPARSPGCPAAVPMPPAGRLRWRAKTCAAFRIDPLAIAGNPDVVAAIAAQAVAALVRRPGARLRHRAAGRDCRGASGARRRARGEPRRRRRSAPLPRRWRRTAFARSSWRAARPRAPSSRRWACARWPSGRRSTPACRGRAPSAASRSGLRSSRAISAGPTSSPRRRRRCDERARSCAKRSSSVAVRSTTAGTRTAARAISACASTTASS